LYNSQLSGRGYTSPKNARSAFDAPAEIAEGAYEFSLRHLLNLVWRRLWLILLTVVVVVGTVGAITMEQTPIYSASVKILVGQEQESIGPGSLGGDVQGLQKLTTTMSEAAKSSPIVEAVIQQRNLPMNEEDVLENLTVRPIGETHFVQIDYEDPSPERAQLIANTVGEVFAKKISEVSPSAYAVTATVWQQAKVPTEPVRPNLLLNILLALVVGLMVGLGIAFLLEYLDDSWQSVEDVEQSSELPNFGVIPTYEVPLGDKEGRVS